MAVVKPDAFTATLIGDVVGSRSHPDRARLHTRLRTALAEATTEALEPPTLTVGDEFQGTYLRIGAAIDAALTLRLQLAPDVDIRFGIGWGAITKLDADTGIQDGPGWWAARDAIEWTAATQRRGGLTHIRTAVRIAPDTGHIGTAAAVNAALMCRDQLLGSLDERSLRLLAGLRAGLSKKELAMNEGISASAVSQRANRDGLHVILSACAELQSVT